MKKFKKAIKRYSNKLIVGSGVVSTAASMPLAAHAAEGGLSINFDVTQMFTWAQTIINALTPVLYVTLGISLGFLIIRSLRSAF